MPIRIIIADDHAVIIEGLKAVLKKKAPDIIITGEAVNGNQALELAKKKSADVYVYNGLGNSDHF